jgi:RNA polymerase sigma-70 factor (ECF subfamily)
MKVESGGEHVTQIDTQRLKDLVDAHGAALTLYARQWCRVPEDALQEALIDLLRQDPIPYHIVGWLYVTVRRRAMNLARAEERRLKHHRQAGEQKESWFVPAGDSLDDPFDLEMHLAQLPRLEREIVVARVWGDLSYEQIAELVEQSTSSVHRRYQQALAELGRMMNKNTTSARQTDEPKPSIT